jgi:hypothetical protein
MGWARLPGGIPSLNRTEVSRPSQPPAIRDMKEPRHRKVRRGFDPVPSSIISAKAKPRHWSAEASLSHFPHPLRAQNEHRTA